MNDFKITGLGVYGTLGGITVHIVKHRPNADCPIYEWYGRIVMNDSPGMTMGKFKDHLDRYGLFDLWGETINFDDYGQYDGQGLSHPLNLIEKKQMWSQLPPYTIRNLGKHISRDGTVVTVTRMNNPSAEGFTVLGHKSAYKKTQYTWRPDGTHHTDPTLAHPLDIVQPYSKLAMERRLKAAVGEATQNNRKTKARFTSTQKAIVDAAKERLLAETARAVMEHTSGLLPGAAALIFEHALSDGVREPRELTRSEIEQELDALRAEQERRKTSPMLHNDPSQMNDEELKANGFYVPEPDPINHPAHYTGHPSGVECIQITEHMNFCRGNAMKYIWRAGEKGDELEDLKKARWYIDREIARLSTP